MIYRQYPAPPELASYIRYFWSYDAHPAQPQELRIKSFADKYPRLIFQDTSCFEPIRYGDGEYAPACYLSGLDTQPLDSYWMNSFSHFGVSFFPHALRTFFGIDATALVNAMPDILFFEKDWLVSQLHKTPYPLGKVSVLSAFFYNKLNNAKEDVLINRLLHHENITADNSMAILAAKYKLSERQLQRRFKMNVGIAWKKFQRIDKFEKAIALLSQNSSLPLIHVSYELGYSDQSHFIKDFREFTGMTPMEYCSKRSLGSESLSFIYQNE